jgi:crotonobetainyl-CoA:carnitine CoA-transferase CaiB-like acyl-CoA transferase
VAGVTFSVAIDAEPAEDAPMNTPLEGLRVVELTSGMTNAQLGQMLADFGAEVVQVEPPGGTPLREHPSYPLWGRGKRSVELDLKSAAGLAEARRLVLAADVVLEAYRPGVAARLGLDAVELTRQNPRLVWSSVTAFGTTGPYVDAPGYEGVVMAKLGAMHVYSRITDRPGPAFLSVSYASWAGVQAALHGILTALYEREDSGAGQVVETSLALALSAMDPWQHMMQALADKYPDALVSAPPFTPEGFPATPFPLMLLIAPTKDGHWLQFSQVQPRLWQAMMDETGLSWMREDPDWKTMPVFDDVQKRVQANEMMIEAVRQRTLAEWQEVFDRNPNVFAEVLRRGTQLLDHPQLAHYGQVVEIDDPVHGPTRQPGPMIGMERTPLPTPRPAPLLNEAAGLADEWDRDRGPIPDAGPVRDGLPLAGVTILELGTFYAAPYGATLLTDLGARVFKIEPIEGEPLRMIVSFPEAGAAKLMQGKESVALDIGSDEGREIVRGLARKSHIVLCSYRAGVAERLGIDARSLMAVNPDLVYLDAPGYGIDGPYGHRPAFAPTISAGTGVTMRNVPDAPLPEDVVRLSTRELRELSVRLTSGANSSGTQPDGISAMAVATALLLGLYAHRRGSGGRRLLTTMLLSTAHALAETMIDYDGRLEAPAADPEVFGLGATYRLYETAKGWVFFAAPSDRDWTRAVGALSPYGAVGSSAWSTAGGRRSDDVAIAETLGEIFRRRTAREWEAELLAQGVGCVVSEEMTMEEAYLGELGRQSGWLVTVNSPIFDEYNRIGPLVRFSRSATHAPVGCTLGQHTGAVLTELGFDADRIDDLRSRGIVAGD